MFFVGLGLFLVASALCGLAPSAEVLIGARVLQAAGAALLVPTSLGLLLPEFPPERRATATALWGAIGGVAAATGPSLGGLLIEWADWRLVFFVNLVLGAVGAGARAAAAARDARPGPRRRAGRAGDRAAGGRRGRAVAGDRRGAGLGLGRARGVLAAFAGAALLLAVFVWRSADAPASGARAVAVPRAVVRGGVRGRRRVRARLLRRAAGEHPVPHLGVGLLHFAGGLRGHAGAADGGDVERARGADDRPLRAAGLGGAGRAAVRARAACCSRPGWAARPRT